MENTKYANCPPWWFCQELDSFSGSWTVPAAPRLSDGQTIYLFIGMEDYRDQSGQLIQTVLQWGPTVYTNCNVGGPYWGIASYLIKADNTCEVGTFYRVNVGDNIVGSMSCYVSNGCGGYWTVDTKDTTTGTDSVLNVLADTNYLSMYNVYVTLEVHGVVRCGDYPQGGGITFSNLQVTGGTPGWNSLVRVNDGCGEGVTVNQQGNPSSVTLSYNSGAGPSLGLDGSNQAYCSHTTTSCTTTLSTTHPNDIILAYTFEALDLASSCTFSVSDGAGLSWTHRAEVSGRNDGTTGSNRDQLAEFWAKSTNVLSSDSVTESISGCASYSYGGEYNGLEVFAVSGANYVNPFDPTSAGTGSDSVSGQQSVTTASISTSNPPDLVIAGVQHATGAAPSPGSGFTMILSSGGDGSEYQSFAGTVSNLGVSFSFNTSSYWQEIADAVR